jgi:hypothetical protein
MSAGDFYFAVSICLYSTGHWIGGSVALLAAFGSELQRQRSTP